MQTIQTPPRPAAAPATESGFRPIPTRMSSLAPLVVDPPSEVKSLVVEHLEALEGQLASVHAIAAEAYLSQCEYAKALTHIEVSVTFAPEDARYQNQCGYLRYLQGDDAGAISAFERVIQQIPEQVDAMCNLGMVCFGMQRYGDARTWFERAIRLTPNDAELWNNLGAAIFQSGDKTGATAYFRKALEIDPANQDAQLNLAAC